MNKEKKLIVVLGMHRSGTSAITRGLQVLGASLGERLMPAIEGINAKGFFEDIEINAFNIELLSVIKSDWFYLSPIKEFQLEKLRQEGYFLRAVALIREKIKSEDVFAFKDPRVAKLLPFWKEVFSHCQINVNYVLALRHPLSVVNSLAKRDGFVAEHSYLLWLGHILESLTGSRGALRVLVDFDHLMQSPDAELVRIAKSLNLEIFPVELQNYKTDFLDQGLRHTTFELNDLLLDSACPAIVRDVYSALLKVASGQLTLDDDSLLADISNWSDEFDQMTIHLRLADTLLAQKLVISVAVSERDTQIASLSQAVSERDEQISSLNQAVAERDGQIAALNQVVIDARNELEQMLASKSWLITKPLRFARRKAVRPFIALRRALSDNGRALWRELPMSSESKRKLKEWLFKTLPWAFRWSKAYQAWDAFSAPANYFPAVITQKRHPGDIEGEYVPLLKAAPLKQKPAKLICFYLPQFHAIPENNEWWGEGFTEWTNVQPAQSQFDGHYQPHVPGELGYYNLLDPVVQRRQVELAQLYGIGGFCFYFYWFGGNRLLEAPIENYLNDKNLDLPFCLCWANENWSRRWDGLDSEILMAQQHSAEDDFSFIEHVARYMRDPRYIRVGGKPLLLVYRPSLLPSAKKTASRWRDWCRTNGLGEIYLAYTQSFEAVDPAKYDFDAAIEFPPSNSAPPNITDSVTPMGDNFGSTVYDWRVFVERSEHYKQQPYTLFRSVCPSWDNTARRKNRGTVFLNSSPSLYQRWLENAIRDTQANRSDPDEHLIFVNAWNEWAEGAHLEPDARYGYAWLQATRNALSSEYFVPDTRRKIVLVAHDAYPHGAQMLAANLAKTLSQDMGFHVDLVCLGGGPLVDDYAKWATVHLLAGRDPRGAEAKALARRLYELGHCKALVNTTVSGLFLETLVGQGIECVALIHELRGVLDQNRLHGHAKEIATHANKVVFPASDVAESFNDVACVSPDKLVIRPQG
ncbi:MAG: glycoside hydrolase family 99-like domain-containing protein, partial [Rugosibacter sp.]